MHNHDDKDSGVRAVIERSRSRCYFLDEEDVRQLARVDPTRMVLLRFHEGRMLCQATMVEHTISALEKDGACLRDASLPSSDPDVRADMDRPPLGFGQIIR